MAAGQPARQAPRASLESRKSPTCCTATTQPRGHQELCERAASWHNWPGVVGRGWASVRFQRRSASHSDLRPQKLQLVHQPKLRHLHHPAWTKTQTWESVSGWSQQLMFRIGVPDHAPARHRRPAYLSTGLPAVPEAPQCKGGGFSREGSGSARQKAASQPRRQRKRKAKAVHWDNEGSKNTQGTGGVLAPRRQWKDARQRRYTKVVEMQGTGSVLATKAVGAHGKGGVLRRPALLQKDRERAATLSGHLASQGIAATAMASTPSVSPELRQVITEAQRDEGQHATQWHKDRQQKGVAIREAVGTDHVLLGNGGPGGGPSGGGGPAIQPVEH